MTKQNYCFFSDIQIESFKKIKSPAIFISEIPKSPAIFIPEIPKSPAILVGFSNPSFRTNRSF